MAKRSDPTKAATLKVADFVAPFDTTGMDPASFPPGVVRETQLQRVNRVLTSKGRKPLVDPNSPEARL